MFKMIYLSAVVFGAMASAARTGTSSVKKIDAILAAYRKAPAVQAVVKKTVVQEILGTNKESSGDFYFSKGKMRLNITKPDASTVVYDGRTIWLESKMDDEVVVTKSRVDRLKKSDSLLTALFDKKGVLDSFKLLKEKSVKGISHFEFSPKDAKRTEVTQLEIDIDGHDVTRISFTDQTENTVTFEFSEFKRGKLSPSLFSYTPPPHAEVTDLK